MNKRKETAAKILTLLGGLRFKEINQILDDVKEEMENAIWAPSPDLINRAVRPLALAMGI